YVVNSLDDRALACRDINEDLVSEPSMIDTGAWAVYLAVFCGLIGIVLTMVQLPGRIAVFKDDMMSALTNALAIFNIVQLFASPIWHRVSERFGRKPPMVLISLNYCVCFVGFALSKGYTGVFVFRGLSGLGAIYGPLGNTIVADLTPLRQRGKALAYLNGSALAGCIVGPFLNIALIKLGAEWMTVTLVAAGFSLLSAIVSFLWLSESAPIRLARDETRNLDLSMGSAPKESGFKATMGAISRNKNLMVVFVGYTVTLGAHCLFKDIAGGIVRTRCNLDNDQKDTLYSYNVLVLTLGGFLASLAVGPLAARIGERGVIYIGQACAAIALTMLVVDSDKYFDYYYYTASSFINGVSDGLAHPAFLFLCSEWASPKDRGMMLGLFQIGNSLGRSVFSLLQGYLYEWDLQASFVIAYIWPLIGFLCTFFVTVPVEKHLIEKAIRDKANEQAPVEAVPV
ncbi:tetracycline resistance protein, TetA/multidrug resistance protein MdtG, partial [Kipferlia bialata]